MAAGHDDGQSGALLANRDSSGVIKTEPGRAAAVRAMNHNAYQTGERERR